MFGRLFILHISQLKKKIQSWILFKRCSPESSTKHVQINLSCNTKWSSQHFFLCSIRWKIALSYTDCLFWVWKRSLGEASKDLFRHHLQSFSWHVFLKNFKILSFTNAEICAKQKLFDNSQNNEENKKKSMIVLLPILIYGKSYGLETL